MSKSPSLIGHAYDYFLQMHCQKLNAILNDDYSLSQGKNINDYLEDSKQISSPEDLFHINSQVREHFYIYEDLEWNHELTKQCLIKGKLELFSHIDDEIDFQNVDDANFKDLESLISHTMKNDDYFYAQERCITRPIFTNSVGLGAEADLIIDDTIIEIKTESNLMYKSYHWHQLLSYYLLSLLSQNGEKISKVAVWNPRYCTMLELEIADLDTIFNFTAFLELFHKKFL